MNLNYVVSVKLLLFLQGMKLYAITTADGEARKACVRPPADIWDFLSQEKYEKALKVGGANSPSWGHLLPAMV